jgi:hypothetical protein
MHRPADLLAVESVLEDLSEVLDAKPEVVRARLRDLVPEYSSPEHASDPLPQQRTHAK